MLPPPSRIISCTNSEDLTSRNRLFFADLSSFILFHHFRLRSLSPPLKTRIDKRKKMKTSLLALIASLTVASTARATSLCSIVSGDLPSSCSCQDQQLGATLTCSVNMLGVETVGVQAVLAPCDSTAHMDLDIYETDLGINYTIAGVSAGEEKDIPIPGLDIDIPVIGNAGVNVAVEFGGNLSELEVKLGLDACIDLPVVGEHCGSALTKELPIWILSGSYDFSSLCSSKGKANEFLRGILTDV